jgi:hypothetical protein
LFDQLVVALADRYEVDIDDQAIAVTASMIVSVGLNTLLMKSTLGTPGYLVLREAFLRNATAIISVEDGIRLNR